jgi:alkyldihydroxyacetonephosphate synthase
MVMSKPSHWGWGEADKFGDRESRRNVGEMVSSMLGFEVQEPDEPVPLDAVELAPSRVEDIGGLPVSTEHETRVRATYGRAYPDILRGYRGDFSNAPDAVATPASETEIVAVLDWADAHSYGVVPRGGGTSVVGGVEPAFDQPSVVLDMQKLDRVLEVDDVSRAARIQAGVLGPDLETQLGEHGLTLRHYPQSFLFSSLGGWIATRAGGHYATVRTHIDEFVASVRAVTPAGELETRRLPASGAGPDPNRWMIGSEGALGVITEAWMRLTVRPRWKATASARFVEWSDAVAATRELAQSGLNPTNARLLDKREAMINGVVMDGSHVLVLGFESHHHPVDHLMDIAVDVVKRHGGTVPDGVKSRDAEAGGDRGAAGQWRDAFFEGPYLQTRLVSLGVMADTFETAVTWDQFDAFHSAIVNDVRDAMKRTGGAGFLTCRLTHVYPDGCAPYFTFVTPTARGGEIEQWQTIKSAASDAIEKNGGTITHHHAVGRNHMEWYRKEVPELWQNMLAGAKRAVDPNGIMNPGVLLES